MADVLTDGVLGLLRPIGARVVDGGSFGGCDGLIEQLNFIVVCRGVVGGGVIFHEAPQVGVETGRIVILRHLGSGVPGKEGELAGGGFELGHGSSSLVKA
jgi:hypothetical protein